VKGRLLIILGSLFWQAPFVNKCSFHLESNRKV